MKKILQTKQRAQEILRLRAENEARLAAKASTVEDLSATDSTRTSEAKPKETAAKKVCTTSTCARVCQCARSTV